MAVLISAMIYGRFSARRFDAGVEDSSDTSLPSTTPLIDVFSSTVTLEMMRTYDVGFTVQLGVNVFVTLPDVNSGVFVGFFVGVAVDDGVFVGIAVGHATDIASPEGDGLSVIPHNPSLFLVAD